MSMHTEGIGRAIAVPGPEPASAQAQGAGGFRATGAGRRAAGQMEQLLFMLLRCEGGGGAVGVRVAGQQQRAAAGDPQLVTSC